MFNQSEFLKMMLGLKAVEAALKCALAKPMPENLTNTCQRDKVERATKGLHEVVLMLDSKFWECLERKR